MHLVREELALMKHDIRSNHRNTANQLTVLERQMNDVAGEDSEVRAVRDDLQSLVQQTGMLVERAEAASKDSEHRDEKLRRLADVVKHVVTDLRRLLDRAHEVAGKNTRAERSARSIHSRLITQTRRSQEFARKLTRIVDSMVACDSKDQPLALARENRSTPIEPPQRTATEVLSWQQDRNRVQRLLQTTQESLSGLRTLAGGSHHGDHGSEQTDSGCGANGQEQPTARLAQQVEGLLELVEPSESVTAS